MASIRLNPPEPFDFKQPDQWEKWRRRFEQFRVASGLSSEEDDRQVSTLLYCLGEAAEDVLLSSKTTDKDRTEYKLVLGKFDEFFKVRKNVIFERARFNRRNQLEGESSEQYVTVLHSLAENCSYGNLKHEMIRDRIVVGIRDTALSERLQLDPELTLEKAMKMVRQREAVKEQQQILKGDVNPSETNVDRVWQKTGGQNPSGAKCYRCGRGPHRKENCPAWEATCNNCQKRGHFSACCRTSKICTIGGEVLGESCKDTAFLGAIGGGDTWNVDIKVNGHHSLNFKIDTGADVSVISEHAFKTLGIDKLSKSGKVLLGPAAVPLCVVGQVCTRLEHASHTCEQTLYVVKGLRANLLGIPAIQALKLLVRINAVDEYTNDIYQRFPQLFQGLGTIDEAYQVKLKPNVTPHALYAARNVPIPLREKVREELVKMERMGVISRVESPTEWCAGIVVVPKKSGDIRICVDLKPLNECILREVHPLPKVDETLALLAGAQVFSKLDANSGFWQIPLSEDSRLLTTFITPFGRYCFNKLPFGISCAPEHFQKVMSRILEGLDGVVCQMDDVLVFGHTQEGHDHHLQDTLSRIAAAGLTLNKEKCVFSKPTMKFLGHIISKNGISPDPDKTAAIQNMPPPESPSDLRRFMGMVTQLGKFSPNLAQISQPLRELLGATKAWRWGQPQEEAFARIKMELTQPAVLVYYDPAADTKVSADASSHGVGAVLLQLHNSSWKPVAFASRSMSETELRYAQIEKEALATTWACEKFKDYLIGKKFSIETDHKPLVPLLNAKYLDSLPPRILRFRLRLMRFDYTISHVPGKLLYTADTLSRAPTGTSDLDCKALQEEVELYIECVTHHLPATERKLLEYQRHQAEDPLCAQVMKYCSFGWPDKHSIDTKLKPFWGHRGVLTVHKGLLLFGDRIVVPKACQKETLSRIHSGHLGIQRCKLRTQQSVWWPGVNKEIESMVEQCQICAKLAIPHKEPMIVSQPPDYPWQKVGSDLF